MQTATLLRTSRYKPSEAVVAQPIAEEMVLLDLSSGLYFSLNGVGAFIWQQLAGGLVADEVAAAVAEEYDVTAERAVADTDAFIERLTAQGLLCAG